MEYKLIAPRRDNTTFLEQILFNRGFTSREEIQHFLTSDEHDINSPLLLDNMREGVQLLAKHIELNSRVLLVVDSDCDGFCSSAILMNYLHCHFPSWIENNWDYFIHSGKQHGLEDVMQEVEWPNYNLIVCPDSASNDYACHAELRSSNIDCLILDHHLADGGYSPDAVTINNQLSDNYPNKALCGGGVVWQFCRYIDNVMGTNYAIEHEDLAALSLIGDMMDVSQIETHQIIKDGLERIKNPFFVEMMNRQKFQFEGGITPFGIAFYIVPYINAMTRSGTMEEKQLMFEAMLEWRSNEMIPSTKRGCKGQIEPRYEQAGRTCVNVKSRQKKAQDASLANIESLIEDENLLDNKLLVLRVPSDQVDKNLAGLIANQLANKYAHPTLVLRKIEEEYIEEPELDKLYLWTDQDDNGGPEILAIKTTNLNKSEPIKKKRIIYAGSGRNYSNSKLEDFRQFCLDTGLVQMAQGHQSAFGCAIEASKFDDFILETNNQLSTFDFSPCYLVDLETSADQLTDQDVFTIASNADIWGQGLDEPLIAITDIKITSDSIQWLGSDKKTLKLTFPGRKTNMIKFHIKDEEKELLDPQGGTLTLTAIGKCALNHFNGNITPQIMLEDFEIVNRRKWDF